MGHEQIPREEERVLICFHGNSEDIERSLPFYYSLREELNVSVIAVEYPGYGYFKNSISNKAKDLKSLDCSTDQILKMSDLIYEYLTNEMGFLE